MNLKPLFAGETHEQRWKTIDDNLAMIGSSLYGSEASMQSEKIMLYEEALKIKDNTAREAFVSLIGTWSYLAVRQIEANASIQCVRRQLDSIREMPGTKSTEAGRESSLSVEQ